MGWDGTGVAGAGNLGSNLGSSPVELVIMGNSGADSHLSTPFRPKHSNLMVQGLRDLDTVLKKEGGR